MSKEREKKLSRLEDYVKFRERKAEEEERQSAPRRGKRLQAGKRIQGYFIISYLFKILFLKTHLTSSAVSLKKNPKAVRDKWQNWHWGVVRLLVRPWKSRLEKVIVLKVVLN